jgi:hypothetical protein
LHTLSEAFGRVSDVIRLWFFSYFCLHHTLFAGLFSLCQVFRCLCSSPKPFSFFPEMLSEQSEPFPLMYPY